MTKANKKTDTELASEVAAKIEEFSQVNRPIARKMHGIITSANPKLKPRLWYGMPGYALSKSGPVLLFFREDSYMTLGITEALTLTPKPGAKHLLMPCAWFFTDIDHPTEAAIEKIVKEYT